MTASIGEDSKIGFATALHLPSREKARIRAEGAEG